MHYKSDFAEVLENLYSLCDEKDMCRLTISGDQYHFNQSRKAFDEYSQLVFFSDERMQPIDDWNLVNEGMAKKNQFGAKDIVPSKKISSYSIYGDDLYIDDMVYINALGDVLPSCSLYISFPNSISGRFMVFPPQANINTSVCTNFLQCF